MDRTRPTRKKATHADTVSYPGGADPSTLRLQEAERLANVTLACQRLGISRKTVSKWRRPLGAAQGDRTPLQALRAFPEYAQILCLECSPS